MPISAKRQGAAVTFALRRGREWIIAPDGDGRPIPPTLGIGPLEQAWLFTSLDDALNSSALLRICWGWVTEVRAIR